jgi:hypothetical protein
MPMINCERLIARSQVIDQWAEEKSEGCPVVDAQKQPFCWLVIRRIGLLTARARLESECTFIGATPPMTYLAT